MALKNQPYLPLYVQDWLSNNKLKQCSLLGHGLMINIMCILHKEDSYGSILLKQKYKQNESNIVNFALMFAKLLPFDYNEICSGLNELVEENILLIDGDLLYCKRMVSDSELSSKRADAGSKGGKKTTQFASNFAQAKIQANTENEYEIENKENIKVSENFSNDHPSILAIAKFFSISEQTNFQVYKLISRFVFELEKAQRVDEFKIQFAAYRKFKTDTKSAIHNVKTFMGFEKESLSLDIERGAWCECDWVQKLKKIESQGTETVTVLPKRPERKDFSQVS